MDQIPDGIIGSGATPLTAYQLPYSQEQQSLK
jgi:hypothetical protein